MSLDELVLVGPEFRIALLHFEEFLGIEIAEESHADYTESVRAHIRDLVGNVQVHAMNECGNGDQGGGGENDPQEGEEAA